ncbi:hypothetical protein Lal_00032815 [Lupinus albus]|nr:hypothetical protein Lal_00032815 [Lupinus albus]
MLLGIQAEISVIMLDLNMILVMAQGLNLIFGWDLFTCIVLTATGAVFQQLLALLLTFLRNILCIFSGLYLVNNVVMNAPANEFYSTDLVLLTLQDALSLIEQVLHSPIGLLVFLLILFLANQVRALTSSFGGEVVVHGYLRLYIPGWFHYAIVRVIAILSAIYCAWSSGAEGIHQLLIFTQVLVVLQLPSSVIPLFQIATSKSIMGVQKISQFVELLALAIFIGMLALNIVFVVEMMFGSSEWMGDLRWNVGNGVSFSYLVLFTTALASICSVLWLAATPLRSASVQLDAQEWNWDTPATVSKPEVDGEESNLTPRKYLGVTSVQVKEPEPKLPSPPKSLDKESASTSEAEAVSTGRRQLAAVLDEFWGTNPGSKG